MRIGINARFLRKPGTGIGQVTTNFLKTLTAASPADRDQLEFFMYMEEEPHFDFPLPPNWTVRSVRTWYRRDDLVREWLWESWVLPRAAVEDRCQAFFSLSQSATLLPRSIRHLMLVHDLVPLHFPEYLGNWRRRFHYRAVRRAIGQATELIAPSEATADDMRASLALSGKKISVVPLGLDRRFRQGPTTENRTRVLAKYGLESGYLYHGGGLEKRKNTERLLEAYAALLRKGLAMPPLVISGTIHAASNPLATDVRAVIARFHLEEKVRLLGFVPDEDLPTLYAEALGFLYPSLFEGFGLPVLEALALGVPTLTSRTSSLPEVAGGAALLTDPNDTQAIAANLRRLVTDRALRESLHAAGPKQAARFSWEQFTRSVLRLLVQ